MTWRQMLHRLRKRVTPEVAFAFDLLETDGLRYTLEFGTENAIEMATDRWLDKLDYRDRQTST
jgi:hypothetical protein